MSNQTDELWLKEAVSGLGTGVFVFSDEHAAEFGTSSWTQSATSQVYGSLQKALLSNVTYMQCVQRGEKDWMVAYKWVPESIASYAAVVSAASSCSPMHCVNRCAS